jgi:hypothetical protein
LHPTGWSYWTSFLPENDALLSFFAHTFVNITIKFLWFSSALICIFATAVVVVVPLVSIASICHPFSYNCICLTFVLTSLILTRKKNILAHSKAPTETPSLPYTQWVNNCNPSWNHPSPFLHSLAAQYTSPLTLYFMDLAPLKFSHFKVLNNIFINYWRIKQWLVLHIYLFIY